MNENNKDNLQNEVERHALNVVCFFDLFHVPLTEMEIWNRLGVKCDFFELTKSLEKISQIEKKDGFYFLRGREEIIKKRLEQYVLGQEKWRIARRATRIMTFIPGVKMVAVCNNFSYKKNSDIDVFVVVKSNRMWLTRLLVTLSMQFFGLRRHGKKVANRICLSFYVSLDNMNLKNLLLPVPVDYNKKEAIKRDPYFLFWMLDMLPLYGADTIKRFWNDNKWLKTIFPNFVPVEVSQRLRVLDSLAGKTIKRVFGFFLLSFVGDGFEKTARFFQKRKMSRNLTSLSKENDSRVVVTDKILKFHEADRREFYRSAWQEILQKNV